MGLLVLLLSQPMGKSNYLFEYLLAAPVLFGMP